MSRRPFLVVSVAAYVAVFNLTYVRLVGSKYEYWGLSSEGPPGWHFVACCVLSILPSLWLPLSLRRPSQLLFLVQYLVLFVPATFIVYYASDPRLPLREAFILNLLMFAGLSLIEAVYLFPVVRIGALQVSPRTAATGFFMLFTGLLAYIAWSFHSVFRLVGLEDVYDLREEMMEVASQTGTQLGVYAQSWLAGFVLPLVFALGVFTRRWWLALAVLPAYVFLFGVAGNKTSLVALAVLPMLYVWAGRWRRHGSTVFVWGLAVLLSLGLVCEALNVEPVTTWCVAIINVRTFAIPPLLIAEYVGFFASHPLTWLSHVHGINLFLKYPYVMDVGRTVSEYYDHVGAVANAGMWAGDGVAGFGLAGIPLISVVCAVSFWVIDCIAIRCDVRFVTVALGAIAMSFANTSLFTTFVSGGLGLLLVSLAVMPERGVFRFVKGRDVPREFRGA